MIFTSKYGGLEIVVVASRYIHDNMGQKRYVNGKRATFVDGIFETNDQEIIDFLLNSPRKGIDFMVFKGNEVDSTVSEAGKEELAKEEAAVQTTRHSCPICSFKAANEFGLKSHMRAKHKDA